MPKSKSFFGPVVIGGVGGSGTRLIAKILSELGFFMGFDLNMSRDNLFFTYLFKRPNWFKRVKSKQRTKIFRALKIFEQIMTSEPIKRRQYLPYVIKAGIGRILWDNKSEIRILYPNGHLKWICERINYLLQAEGLDLSKHIGWGWKEPNSQIFLEFIVNYFKNVKYIQVIRNGLDIAFSRNKSQLSMWGYLFNVSPPTSPRHVPKAALEYWIKVNKYVLSIGKQKLGDNFYLLKFERLCLSPKEEIEDLLRFLEIKINGKVFSKLISIPKVPESLGRYKNQDLSMFNQKDLEAVKKLFNY